MPDWENLGAVSPTQLTEARLETHHAAQWLARATRAYCTPVPDDSHTSLTWDSNAALLVTQNITPTLALGLRFNPLSIVAMNDKANESLSLFDRTEKDIRAWFNDLLKEHQLDPSKFDAPGPYTLPKHPLDSGLAYGLATKESFDELERYFHNATVLFETVKKTQTPTSPVRCWPHHFDIATLISLDTNVGEHARSIGVGMSPGDDTYTEPYFYISPWPYPSQSNLPEVMAPAFWHREGFSAVILTGSTILSTNSRTQQENTTLIVNHAITLCHDLLKN